MCMNFDIARGAIIYSVCENIMMCSIKTNQNKNKTRKTKKDKKNKDEKKHDTKHKKTDTQIT